MIFYCGKNLAPYLVRCRKMGGICIVVNDFLDCFFWKKMFLINFLFFEFIFKLVSEKYFLFFMFSNI